MRKEGGDVDVSLATGRRENEEGDGDGRWRRCLNAAAADEVLAGDVHQGADRDLLLLLLLVDRWPRSPPIPARCIALHLAATLSYILSMSQNIITRIMIISTTINLDRLSI